MLAHLPDQEIDSILAQGLESYTKYTITDAAVLRQHLQDVKKMGYAVDMEELELGLRCVAAPVHNNTGAVIAAISLSGVGATMTQDKLPTLIKHVKEGAQEVSYRLGYALGHNVQFAQEGDAIVRVVVAGSDQACRSLLVTFINEHKGLPCL